MDALDALHALDVLDFFPRVRKRGISKASKTSTKITKFQFKGLAIRTDLNKTSFRVHWRSVN